MTELNRLIQACNDARKAFQEAGKAMPRSIRTTQAPRAVLDAYTAAYETLGAAMVALCAYRCQPHELPHKLHFLAPYVWEMRADATAALIGSLLPAHEADLPMALMPPAARMETLQ